MTDILTSILLLAGTLFMVAAAIGLVRLPDFYSRVHAQGLAATLGLSLIVLASMLSLTVATGSLSIKQVLVVVFLFLTGPVGSHMIARSAARTGVRLWEKSVLDERPPEMRADNLGGEEAQAGTGEPGAHGAR